MPDEPQKQVDESEFMDIAKDPAEARVLRRSLELIARGGAGDTLKEMAQEVLSGRIGLRQATQTSGYGDALLEKGQWAEWNEMSDAERHARAVEGEKALDAERREMAEERAAQGRSSSTEGRHSGKGWSAF
ncbi:hypothetical protein ACIRPT_18755 [Streptomyces sp. NPDC101227]|uniref:hypothetical protein n=1 Tax=Streptomyces sp. NPDC101227 TaxID=3366136 RepID=UPI0038191604